MAADDPQAVNKLAERLTKGEFPDAQQKRDAIAAAMEAMELDPEVTKRTLGQPYKNLSADAVMAITQKLLAVHRGEQEPDDRDHMAYQTIVGPEDVFAERIRKAKSAIRNSLWKASATKSLDRLPPGIFNRAIQSGLLTSGLGAPLEEVNTGELLDQQTRVTRMGEGGMTSTEQITEDARAVQPSQLGFVDFLRTAESEKAGVDLRLARNAVKGDDGRIYTPVTDVATGKQVYKSPQDLADAVLAFPDELARGADYVAALAGGRVQMVPRGDVQFELPDMEGTFSPLGNMVPMKSLVKGQRAVMAARMLSQALPLKNPEAPWVQSAVPGQPDRSFEEEYGHHFAAVKATTGGVVRNVTSSAITVADATGKETKIPLYENFALNRKTAIHQTPVVQVGDQVRPGQLIAHSNYTTPQGTAALGQNARVAYIAAKGLNFEDAVVISRSFAKRLTSEHMYQHSQEWEPEHKRGKSAYVSIFPTAYPKAIYENFTDDGVIKKGTEVKHNDPLILAVKERKPTQSAILRRRRPDFTNAAIVWEHETPGVVTDIYSDDKGAHVIVKTAAEMQVGDKLAGRYGDKSVVAAVLPDAEMPQDAQGRPAELLVNPLGLISRTNAAQVVEAALGKIAAARGEPYKVMDFKQDDMVEYALEELRKHGMTDTEDVVDPATGRKIRNVLVGNRWFMKLHHTAEAKAAGRGIGGYTATGEPAKGSRTGSKRLGTMEVNALLSHGAVNTLRDASLVRGQASPEYWTQFMSGYRPPTPEVPFVYKQFVNQLKASGINVVRDGTMVNIMALTDKDTDQLAGTREIKNAETVDWRTMKPKAGGLFDASLTGGPGGNRWAYIKLHEPLPSPVMEEPIRRILGLTEKQLHEIIQGKQELKGRTGPVAIKEALDRLNLTKEIERARAEIHSGKRTARDAAVRRLGYLRSAERLGIHPRDWVISKVPVLPPAFRPVLTGPKNLPMVADANFLYKELFDANKMVGTMQTAVGEDIGDERLATYQALKGVTGLGDPIHPKNQERQVRGILKHIFGASPKLGTVQRRLLGSSVDFVGRSVITPNPDLDMDQVAVPENSAWEIYRPFVIRRLVQSGMPRLQAARVTKERSAAARDALVAEMSQRPVIVNRAPTLHRYGIMAAWPRLTKNSVLEVSPLTVKGFGADFNGDSTLTALLPVRIGDTMFLGTFERFIQAYIMPTYTEEKAVELFGKQTTVFQFVAGPDVLVPGTAEDGTVSWQRAECISIHTTHGPDCYQVKTARGLDAVFTAHHNFVMLTADCQLVAAKTEAVQVGALLPTVFNFDTTLPATVAAGRPTLPLTFDTGLFLGYYLGDGSLTGREDTVSMASTIPEHLDLLEKLGATFSQKVAWREGNGSSVRWTDKVLYSWLQSQFGHGFAHKRIPGWCLTAPRDFRAGLLLGVMLAEQCLQRGTVRVEMANRPLLLCLQAVAATLGIASTVRAGKPERPSPQTDARLAATTILRVNWQTLLENMPQWPPLAVCAQMRGRKGRIMKRAGYRVWDRVPYPTAIAAAVNAHAHSFIGEKGVAAAKAGRKSAFKSPYFVSRADRRTAEQRGSCTRAMARKLIELYQLRELADTAIHNWLRLVDNTQLLWDVVEAVDKTDRPDVTYDFHVPGGETFCIDGFFLTHNSVNYHVPTTEEARQEAIDKLLPSRNLLSVADFKAQHMPSQEYVGGLYEASARVDTKNKPRVFATVADAIRAYRRGEIDVDRQVEILNQ